MYDIRFCSALIRNDPVDPTGPSRGLEFEVH